MPLFRKDPFGRAWVLLSPERGLESSDFGSVPPSPATSPLSPGNEGRVGTEIASVQPTAAESDRPEWRMRVIEHPARLVGPRPFALEGEELFLHGPSAGHHEIIVEHPDARLRLETMPRQHLTEVLKLYRDRLALAAERPGIRHVQLTRNVGQAAGALFDHPHAQVLAVPVGNRWVEEEVEVAGEYHQEHGRCLYCAVLDRERELRQRIVSQNEAFVVLAPFASKTPFETWVLPLRHDSAFHAAPSNTLGQLADILQVLVRGLNAALDHPPYNLVVHTITTPNRPDFHWHIEVLPRLTRQAGFDWGTGFFVNPTPPEDAVRFLREALAMQEVQP